jgi:hypothetical protein
VYIEIQNTGVEEVIFEINFKFAYISEEFTVFQFIVKYLFTIISLIALIWFCITLKIVSKSERILE